MNRSFGLSGRPLHAPADRNPGLFRNALYLLSLEPHPLAGIVKLKIMPIWGASYNVGGTVVAIWHHIP